MDFLKIFSLLGAVISGAALLASLAPVAGMRRVRLQMNLIEGHDGGTAVLMGKWPLMSIAGLQPGTAVCFRWRRHVASRRQSLFLRNPIRKASTASRQSGEVEVACRVTEAADGGSVAGWDHGR